MTVKNENDCEFTDRNHFKPTFIRARKSISIESAGTALGQRAVKYLKDHVSWLSLGTMMNCWKQRWFVLPHVTLMHGLMVFLRRWLRGSQQTQSVRYSEEISENAIEVYVGRARKKLVDSKAQIETVRSMGYRLKENA